VFPWLGCCLLALGLGRGAVRADDAPAAPAAPAPPEPPAAPEGLDPGALLAEAQAPLDLHALLVTLMNPLEAQRTPPRKTATDRALFDAWTAILEPRLGRMIARMKRIAEEPRWTPASDGSRRGLKPESWDVVLREVASLYAELGGALAQYERFQVSFTLPGGQGLFAAQAGPPDPHAQERALERLGALESHLAWKLALGQVIWTEELSWVWNLARHAELEMRRYQDDLARWERQVAAFEDLQARIAYGLSFQRQTLSMLMFGLRALVSGLQAGEEDRLRNVAATLPEGDARRAEAERLLEELRAARNAAENHGGAQPATWGSLLRQRWNAPRLRLRALLKA
jgi:hypothetical protein